MEKFFSALLTIIIAVWLLGFLLRLVGPWLLARFVKRLQNRAQEQFGEQFGGGSSSATAYDDGEVTIQYTRQHKSGNSLSDDLGGEYVDFEEVKEDAK